MNSRAGMPERQYPKIKGTMKMKYDEEKSFYRHKIRYITFRTENNKAKHK